MPAPVNNYNYNTLRTLKTDKSHQGLVKHAPKQGKKRPKIYLK